MARLLGVLLILAGLAFGGLFAVPRMIDAVDMGRADACLSKKTDDCLEEVQVLVVSKDDGLRTNYGPELWTLKRRGGGEEELRTPWSGDELDIDGRVVLQLWDGEPVAVRQRGGNLHSIGWGANRWILWVGGTLALLMPGFTLLTRRGRLYVPGEPPPPELMATLWTQIVATFIAAVVMYPAYSSTGAFGAVVVIAGWLWVTGDLMIRGPRSHRPSGSSLRGLT